MTEQGDQRTTGYPLGVVVVIVIAALRCVTIGAGLLGLQGGPVAEWVRAASPLPESGLGPGIDFVARVLLGALLVASVLVIVGLLGRRHWAWVLAIVSCGVVLAIDLGWWWGGDPRYGSMLLNVVAVFYLNQRDVRSALRGTEPVA